MFQKHKILLSIIQEFGENIKNEKLNLLLFFYVSEFSGNRKFYSFINSKKMPFSLTLLEDKRYLIEKNLLESSESWIIKNKDKRFIFELDMFEKMNIQDLRNKFFDKNIEELQEYLWKNYQDFFVKSIDENLQKTLYTIGYESLDLEEYINKLTKENVGVLVDVRKNAYSQKFGFSKKELKQGLEIVNIKYFHISNLGIESENRKSLDNKLDYFVLFQDYSKELPQKMRDIEFLLKLLEENGKIAITCFEKDCEMCHRKKIVEFMKSRSGFVFDVVNL